MLCTHTLCVLCITIANSITSVFGIIVGIVTRCPLELKLKKTPTSQEWKGKISYRNISTDLQHASEVENAIRNGEL